MRYSRNTKNLTHLLIFNKKLMLVMNLNENQQKLSKYV